MVPIRLLFKTQEGGRGPVGTYPRGSGVHPPPEEGNPKIGIIFFQPKIGVIIIFEAFSRTQRGRVSLTLKRILLPCNHHTYHMSVSVSPNLSTDTRAFTERPPGPSGTAPHTQRDGTRRFLLLQGFQNQGYSLNLSHKLNKGDSTFHKKLQPPLVPAPLMGHDSPLAPPRCLYCVYLLCILGGIIPPRNLEIQKNKHQHYTWKNRR